MGWIQVCGEKREILLQREEDMLAHHRATMEETGLIECRRKRSESLLRMCNGHHDGQRMLNSENTYGLEHTVLLARLPKDNWT